MQLFRFVSKQIKKCLSIIELFFAFFCKPDVDLCDGEAQVPQCLLNDTLTEKQTRESLLPHKVERFIENTDEHQGTPRFYESLYTSQSTAVWFQVLAGSLKTKTRQYAVCWFHRQRVERVLLSNVTFQHLLHYLPKPLFHVFWGSAASEAVKHTQ